MLRSWTAAALVTFALALPLVAPAGAAIAGPASDVSVVEFPLPNPDSRPYTIVAGPNGSLWFTESSRGAIGQITPWGSIKEYMLPDPGSGPYGITLGADRNLWFTERFTDRIGNRTAPSGSPRRTSTRSGGSTSREA